MVAKQTAKMMCAAAGFHRHHAARHPRGKLDHAVSAQPPTQNDMTGDVHFDFYAAKPGGGVYLSTDGGAYVTVASSLASPTFDRPLAPGHTYRAAVQATDVAGNVRPWGARRTT